MTLTNNAVKGLRNRLQSSTVSQISGYPATNFLATVTLMISYP